MDFRSLKEQALANAHNLQVPSTFYKETLDTREYINLCAINDFRKLYTAALKSFNLALLTLVFLYFDNNDIPPELESSVLLHEIDQTPALEELLENAPYLRTNTDMIPAQQLVRSTPSAMLVIIKHFFKLFNVAEFEKSFFELVTDPNTITTIRQFKTELVRLFPNTRTIDINNICGANNANLLIIFPPELLNVSSRTLHDLQTAKQLFDDAINYNITVAAVQGFTDIAFEPFQKVLILPETTKRMPIITQHSKLPLEWFFDNIAPTSNYAFVQYKDFYKLYTKSRETTLLQAAAIAAATSTSETDSEPDNITLLYSSAKLSAIAMTKTPTHGLIVTYNSFPDLAELRETFKFRCEFGPEEIVSIKCTYTIAVDRPFDREIFTFLVMNHPQFIRYVVKNDNIFHKAKTRPVKLSLVYFDTHTFDKTVIMLEPTSGETIGGGVSVTLSGISDKTIELIQTILAKLFRIYKTEYDTVSEIHAKYTLKKTMALLPTPSVPDDTDYYENSSLTLRQKYPHIFAKNYTRVCSLQRNPIVSNSNPEHPHDPSKYMLFPTPSRNHTSGPLCFTCPNPDQFIGVVVNKLENKDEYSHLPCCFKTDQINNKKRTEYFKTAPETTNAEPDNRRLITTYKFVREGKYGKLPDLLQTVMEPGMVRRGGFDTATNSFLDCVLTALNVNGYRTAQNKAAILTATRHSIASRINGLAVARQECWDISDLRQVLCSGATYFSPLRFIRLVEAEFDICIVHIRRDESNNITMPVPNNTGGHYINKSASKLMQKTVIIYEHVGGIWGKPNLRCELVVQVHAIDGTVAHSFQRETHCVFLNSLDRLYAQLNSVWISQTIVRPFDPPVGTITAQYIDSRGKCYGVFIESQIYIHFTRPCAPYDCKSLLAHKNYTPNHRHNVEHYISNSAVANIETQYLRKSDNLLTLMYDNGAKVILTYGPAFPGITVLSSSSFPVKQDDAAALQSASHYKHYVKTKKYAQLLKQYVLHKYNKTSDPKPPLETFVKSMVRPVRDPADNVVDIVPFKYVISTNPKVIKVDSNDTVERIVQTLQVEIQRLPQIPTDNYFIDFYTDVSDFVHHRNTTLLKGAYALTHWISSRSIQYLSPKFIILDSSMKIETINDRCYYVKDVPTLCNGLVIGKTWDEYGYESVQSNYQDNSTWTAGLQYTLYYYNADKSGKMSSPHQRGTVANPHNIIIAGALRKFMPTKYSVLLDVTKNRQSYLYRLNGFNYIVQPCSSYFEAIKIAWMWGNYKYNPFKVSTNEYDILFPATIYKCDEHGAIVSKIQQDGCDPGPNGLKLVGYKVRAMYIFSALLKM